MDYEGDPKKSGNHRNEEDMIDIKLPTFEQRYRYCDLMKKTYKSKRSSYEWLEDYFGKSQLLGKVEIIDDQEVVYLSEVLFNLLED